MVLMGEVASPVNTMVPADGAEANGAPPLPPLIDIAFNLADESFAKKDDFEHIIQRAADLANVTHFIACTGSLKDVEQTFALCERLDPECKKILVTVGVHPTRVKEFEGAHAGNDFQAVDGFDSDAYMAKLGDLVETNKKRVVAWGEFGLDFEREHFADRETQKKWFRAQLVFQRKNFPELPLFLHSRGEGCCAELLAEIQRVSDEVPTSSTRGGVIHSFDGTAEEVSQIVNTTNFDIGINGCSLKTEQNCTVVAQIPLERLHLETDSPYCDIRPSSFGFCHVVTKFEMTKKFQLGKIYKSRNEPVRVREVAEVVAGVRGCSVAEVAVTATRNSRRLFRLGG